MENITLLIIGLLISVIGIMNIKGNISSIHWYNRRKVKQEDVPKYGKLMGIGTLLIGITLIILYVLIKIDLKYLMDWIVIPLIIVSIGIMLYAQFKYNKGIF